MAGPWRLSWVAAGCVTRYFGVGGWTMRILLCNDDGYFAPGIEHLARALADVAEVTVVAPERDRSGASNSLTLDRPLSLKQAASP